MTSHPSKIQEKYKGQRFYSPAKFVTRASSYFLMNSFKHVVSANGKVRIIIFIIAPTLGHHSSLTLSFKMRKKVTGKTNKRNVWRFQVGLNSYARDGRCQRHRQRDGKKKEGRNRDGWKIAWDYLIEA